MLTRQLPNGRLLMDREALATLTGRPAATIRARCTPIGHARGQPLYDTLDACALLDVTEDVDVLTAAQAHQQLGIPAGTIRSWASRSVLVAFVLDEQDRPLYRTADLVALRNATTRLT